MSRGKSRPAAKGGFKARHVPKHMLDKRIIPDLPPVDYFDPPEQEAGPRKKPTLPRVRWTESEDK